MRREPPVHEPHKIKTVRPIAFPSAEERKKYLVAAHFNVFNLTPSEVTHDMCSFGTSAMSQEQLAGQLVGDEAYAGARNFENLVESAKRVFGHAYLCPTHNALGSLKLVMATILPPGSILLANSGSRNDLFELRGVRVIDVRDRKEPLFPGNVDLDLVRGAIRDGGVTMIGMQCFADGRHPFSLANLKAVRELADRSGLRLLLDGSRIIENAWYIQSLEEGHADRSIADIVKLIAKFAHVLHVDGAQDPKANAGGILMTDNPADHERFINEVVVYEGLHTYGGMAGRTMEVVARGIDEMCDEAEVQWVMHQTETFTARLRAAGVPLDRGCDGAYIEADKFLPHIAAHPQHALSAALYQTAGIRAVASGLVGHDSLLPVQIPRLAMTNAQLERVADAIIALFERRDRITPLEAIGEARWHDQLRFRGVFADLPVFEWDTYPFVIHTIERVAVKSREEREKAMREAGWNTFLLRSADVTIDLLTDSGTTAMSTDQWAAYDGARATPCTSDEYRHFVDVVRKTYGYQHVIPTHQGRAAEQILSQAMIRKGQYVPGNMYFTTTKEHQEMAGGIFVDVIVDQAHDPASDHPWKGDIDLAKLRAIVDQHGASQVAYISFEFSVNMAGGQPVSMDNIRDVYAYCSPRGIPVFFDATRAVENALMIQKRDPRYKDTKVADILLEMMLYGDGCTVSGKKDFLINIGGLLAFKDNAAWKEKCDELARVLEGSVTDGGLATADIAAMARGMEEMLDDRYIRTRVSQTEQLGNLLLDAGVPIVMPPGTHAIFLDAKRFLPHVDQDEYPAQRLADEIYIETGVRAMERGNVSKGRDSKTGKNYRPSLELVRLTIPRRVYTHDHMKAIAQGIIRLWNRRGSIRGLKFVYEPPHLRFFQARFAPIEE
jgi:tyrosine phenol-lyase